MPLKFGYNLADSKIVWISDGYHSVHLFTATDVENTLNEADGNDGDQKIMHLPGSETSITITD